MTSILPDTLHSALDSNHDFLPVPAPAASAPSGAEAAGAARQVVIIDANLADAATLASAAPAGSLVFMLDGARSGVEQVGEILKSVGQVDSLHLVSHGGPGYFLLGSDVVSSDTASHYAAAFQSWGASLRTGADLLFYGCQVAASSDGQTLVDQIGAWTGADVAASNNISGIDGDWVLEHQQGVIEAQALAGEAYQHDLGPPAPTATTFLVTTLDDELSGGGTLAAELADGKGLSLREALALAHGNNTLDTIVFDPLLFADGQMHTLKLTRGQLDITAASNGDGINIIGAGSSLLTISGDDQSGIFSAKASGVDASTTISGLTLSDGSAKQGSSFFGGAIYLSDAGSLALDHVVIKDSYAFVGGGRVFQGQY